MDNLNTEKLGDRMKKYEAEYDCVVNQFIDIGSFIE